MPKIKLPDGSVKEYTAGATGAQLAAAIGKRLAKDAVAVKVNGQLADLTKPLDGDIEFAVITRQSPEGL